MNQTLESIDSLAKRLGVPKSWIYSRTRTGTIPHIKLGRYVRFDAREIDEWLKNQKVDSK